MSTAPNVFVFDEIAEADVAAAIARYPAGKQASAVMPLLDIAQRQLARQTGSAWVPRAAMDEIARRLGMAAIRVYEVATFYLMYNTKPVGKFHLQACTTTPCWLRGSDDVVAACKRVAGITSFGETSADGLFTLTEVECMGNCASAPMFQINDDNYEDLTADSAAHILDELAAGRSPKPGTQLPGRHTVEPLGGPTTLTAMVDANHDYRGEW
jgi:NADH-quinone oxidoreductase subunit E